MCVCVCVHTHNIVSPYTASHVVCSNPEYGMKPNCVVVAMLCACVRDETQLCGC